SSGLRAVTNGGWYRSTLPSVAIVSRSQAGSGFNRSARVAKKADLASRPRISRTRAAVRARAAASSLVCRAAASSRAANGASRLRVMETPLRKCVVNMTGTRTGIRSAERRGDALGTGSPKQERRGRRRLVGLVHCPVQPGQADREQVLVQDHLRPQVRRLLL